MLNRSRSEGTSKQRAINLEPIEIEFERERENRIFGIVSACRNRSTMMLRTLEVINSRRAVSHYVFHWFVSAASPLFERLSSRYRKKE